MPWHKRKILPKHHGLIKQNENPCTNPSRLVKNRLRMDTLNGLKKQLFMMKEHLVFAGTLCLLLFYIVQHRLWDLEG